ncbi:MAG: hypothetical protein PWQ96_1540 [Clostridia bacterium]|nr:hypothetical protein [Clostridiales bacterium]MDK2985897.1 hypothetical protein [Clostridia bacterium]
MRMKLIILLAVALLVVVAIPVFAAGNDTPVVTTTPEDEEIQQLNKQMWQIREKIAEKRGEQLPEYDEEFFNQMYDYCNRQMGGMMGPNGMMGGYGPQNSNYGMSGGMMGW